MDGPLIQNILKEQICLLYFAKLSPQIHMGSGGPNFKSIVDDTIRARKRYCKLNWKALHGMPVLWRYFETVVRPAGS